MKILTEGGQRLITPYTNNRLNCLGLKFKALGEATIREGKVCLVVLAGGQGTRLGFGGPKGLYEIEGIGTLFGIFQRKIRELESVFGVRLKTFVMTSEFTHDETMKFFEGTDVELFKQASEFCLDENNNFIPLYDSYAKAPNGNGGVYQATKSIDLSPYEIVNVVSVDNVLAKVFDPVAVGCFVSSRFDALSKSVTKRNDESVGVFVLTDRIEVREYSELDCKEEKAQANILNHLFSARFLEEMQDKELEYHYANKKIKYTVDGKLVTPERPNGYKKELFIFDSLRFTTKSGVMSVPRELEFSPLKNGPGADVDSPSTCARDYKRVFAVEKGLSGMLVDGMGVVPAKEEAAKEKAH